MLALIVLLPVVWLLLHGELYDPILNSMYSQSTAFVLGVVTSFVAVGAFGIGYVYLIIKLEKTKDARRFFKVERLDVKGIWLCFGLGLALQIINAAFLWQLVLKPARDFLSSLGLSGSLIGVGSASVVPSLSPAQAAFLTLFLLIFWWIEVPEELFFRGYVQNRLQNVVGKNIALLLSATIWDLSHLFGLVSIVERFFYGLVYAVTFRLRQNSTPTMIVHPIGNRSYLLAATIPAIFGTTLDTGPSLLLTLLIDIFLLLAVISLWKKLRIDRRVDAT